MSEWEASEALYATTLADVEVPELLAFMDAWVSIEATKPETRDTRGKYYADQCYFAVGRLRGIRTVPIAETDGLRREVIFTFDDGSEVRLKPEWTSFRITLAPNSF